MSLVLGYDSSVGFRLQGITLPNEATFTAQLRSATGALLGTLTTAAGTISVASDEQGVPTVTISLLGSVTRAWTVSEAFVDVVRTDGAAPQHLGFKARLRFLRPATVIE
jgi:hypothetical protein